MIDERNFKDFPFSADLSNYGSRYPVGPDCSSTVLYKLLDKGSAEKLDCDSGMIESIAGDSEIEMGGDILYAIWKARDWLYIYSTDLEWGILLSNIPGELILDEVSFEQAKVSFMQSYHLRVGKDKQYYDARLLGAWRYVAGVA